MWRGIKEGGLRVDITSSGVRRNAEPNWKKRKRRNNPGWSMAPKCASRYQPAHMDQQERDVPSGIVPTSIYLIEREMTVTQNTWSPLTANNPGAK